MPKLAAFPKAYMEALCRDGSMSVREWSDIAAGLEIDGVEWYAGFIENAATGGAEFRRAAGERGLEVPMLCCSPDFTHPDPAFREGEIVKEKRRVLTMHASDRYLAEGTLADLRREEAGAEGYAKRLRHGQVGEGLNDYDAIFAELAGAGFDGWISIEDGVDGLEQRRRSVVFLRQKIACYW